MHTNISDVVIKPIKVRPQQPRDKKSSSNNSKRLSKQGSMSTNPANEVYYGDSSISVPFTWESRPGTPKVSLHERRPLPPLTPPPSYLSSPARKPVKKHDSETVNSSGILHNVLPKLKFIRKSHLHSSPSLSSSSSTSSSSVSSSPWSSSPSVRSLSPCTPPKSADVPRRRLAFNSRRRKDEDEEDNEYEESNFSSLCLGIIGRCNTVSNARTSRGCSANFIKLLLGEHA